MAANCRSSFDVATATSQEPPQFSLIQLHPALHEKVRKSYILVTHTLATMDQPSDTHHQSERETANLAANMIRQKINKLHESEPSAKAEALEAAQSHGPRSKHQAFMYQLTTAGKSLAEIQTAWHSYYQELPDHEKHEVWQEFYAAHQSGIEDTLPTDTGEPVAKPAPAHEPIRYTKHRRTSQLRSVHEIKHRILHNTSRGQKLKAHQHLQSLLFGLGLGSLVLLVLLFGFFNERFVAPFITPSRHVSSTPIIIDPNGGAVDPQPKIIIPKINVEIPVVYDEPSVQEQAIQKALERGVAHYATTANPGEQGNSVIFGHSSNNIFNQGRYKFAFVLLSRLEQGDLFYLTKDGKRYVYRVFKKEIVKPTAVEVLGNTGKVAAATLITCDPPGTSTNRLVVVGEQISPDPAANTASTARTSNAQPKILASNALSLWQKLRDWLTR